MDPGGMLLGGLRAAGGPPRGAGQLPRGHHRAAGAHPERRRSRGLVRPPRPRAPFAARPALAQWQGPALLALTDDFANFSRIDGSKKAWKTGSKIGAAELCFKLLGLFNMSSASGVHQMMNADDWASVLVVFGLGKEWQFKDWPFSDHVYTNIFLAIFSLGTEHRPPDSSIRRPSSRPRCLPMLYTYTTHRPGWRPPSTSWRTGKREVDAMNLGSSRPQQQLQE